MSLRGKQRVLARAWSYLRDQLGTECDFFKRWTSAAVKAPFRTHRFDEVSTFVVFLAHQRTGHSLMGQLLNAHPNILISHELDTLEYVRRGLQSQGTLFSLIYDRELWFRRVGRQWAGYNYQVPGVAQDESKQLSVVGDKAGGYTATHVQRDPTLLTQLSDIVDVDLRVIHVERHPLDAIASEHREYTPTMLGAISQFFHQCDGIQSVLSSSPSERILTIYFEEFVEKTVPQLRRIADFLAVEADSDWLRACDHVVDDKPSISRDTVEWTQGQREAVAALSNDYPFLERYEFGESLKEGSEI